MTMPVPVHRDPAPGLTAGSGAEIRYGLVSRLSAEAFGSLFIVVAGLGVPLFSIPQSSPLPAALAAGLAVTAAMLAFGYVSGGHFNPAVTVGHAVAGRIRLGDAAAYIGAQLVGGLLGALALFGILRTLPGIQDSRTAFDTVTAGFGEHSIIQAPLAGVLLLEVLGAAILVAVFLGTTARNNVNKTAAAVAVGLACAVLLQLGQSVGNAPFNPARATASAVFSSSWSLEQLWLFWVAPLAGAAIAGLVFRGFAEPVAAVTASDADGPVYDVSAAVGGAADDVEDFDDDEDADVVEEAAEVPAKAAAPAKAAPVHSAADEPDNRDEAQEFFDGKRG
ncbi:MIP/aquaporin family protein [Pseudarthrobacter raffinosi]|uniref:MIP/aquaporin family protein n=1 Tax=Pseudarthrobacter raffinosi TaxID=2953651 RepID=UPI00208E278B|nr:aquaporin [Pseudarthrobacter sp. MDT3-9]MCO4251776.1 aquaporin [Pseudarthrobacter sp. MDT3-9]